jgi:hypothetical protein
MRKVINFQLIFIFMLLMLISFCCVGYTAEENLTWDKTFGGSDRDVALSIIRTEDGGYAISGYTRSKGKGKADAWVIKLDEWGNMVWDKTFGLSDNDVAFSIIQTEDGGYAISGYTIFKNIGEADFYIIILDEKGNKLWNKIFFESNWDCAYSIIQTKDEGYVISGYTWSKGVGKADAWVIKLNNKGNMVWNKTFGGYDDDIARSIIQTEDGDYVIVGETQSKGAGEWDAWIIKLDEQGNMEWDKTIGGSYWDSILSIIQTEDGDYVVAGWTMSKGAGEADAWIIKLDEKGNLK